MARKRTHTPPQVPSFVAAIVLATLLAVTIDQLAQGDASDFLPETFRRLPPPVEESPPPQPTISFTVAATGDILIHSAVMAQAQANATGDGPTYDFSPMFEPVEPLLSKADVALCHLEVPLSPDNTGLSSYPLFNAPGDLAIAIKKAGYDSCSVASNHSLDKGPEGASDTIRVLERERLEHEGTARNPREESRRTVVRFDGVSVGHISYTYGLNPGPAQLYEDQPWLVNFIDKGRILKDARATKEAGADFVVASFHWGLEYQSTPTEEQRRLARKLLRSEAIDLIVGHHAHVVQPIERIGDEYVVYGMGNFLSHQAPGVTETCCPAETQDGVIVHAEVSNASGAFRVEKLTYTPTWVEPVTHRILPVADIINEGSDAEKREALVASFRRTVATIKSLGAHRAGVRPSTRPK